MSPLDPSFATVDADGHVLEPRDSFPRLKLSVLESGANWISAWLDRMDHKFEVMKSSSPLVMKPSEYFYRQCVVSADPDETLTGAVVAHMGDDYFVWASDYPHVDADYGVRTGRLRLEASSCGQRGMAIRRRPETWARERPLHARPA